jgi:hypothetical protein
MLVEEMVELFTKYSDLGCSSEEFRAILPKFSSRPDLHAMMLIDSIAPDVGDMIPCAEHDQIWFGVELESLAEWITEDQVKQLAICGLFIDGDALTTFV